MREIRIVLIHPPKPKVVKAGRRSQWARPLGLHYMAAMLTKQSFAVTILDFEKDVVSDSRRAAILRDNPADLFAITGVTYTRFEAIKIASEIKRIFPKSVVIVGGVHFRFVAEDTLKNVKEIDIVGTDLDGENVILDVAEAIVAGKKIKEMDTVSGIVFRENGEIVRTAPGILIKELDQFPFYTSFNWEDYPEHVITGNEKLRAMTIITSRGCPYRCAFCSMGGYRFRVRSPGAVLDEIEYFKERFKIKAVHFYDSTFAASPKHCRDIANEMIRRETGIKWSCGLRADTPLDLLPLMKEAGMVSFSLGVETGSSRILESVSKDITLGQVEELIERAEQLGIEVSAFFMLSHPNEDFKDALETVKLREKLKRHKNVRISSFTVSMIFPGTQLERLAKERGILPCDFSWSLPYESKLSEKFAMFETVPIYIEKLTPAEIEEIFKIDRFRKVHWGRSPFQLIVRGVYAIFINRHFHALFNYFVLMQSYFFSKIRHGLNLGRRS